MMANTELKSTLQQAGAVFADGGEWPLHFGSAAEEYAQHDQSALLFCLQEQSLLEVTGADRATFLHKFCTNDIANLPAGRWCEAFVTDINSHVIAHLQIYAESNSLWIIAASRRTEALLAHLDRYIFNDDIAFHDRTADYELLLCSGEKAAELMNQQTTVKMNEHQTDELLGENCAVSRVDRLHQPGYLMRVPVTHTAPLWQKLIDMGAAPAGSLAYDALRIEAKWPVDGLDIREKTLAQEVGRTQQAISFTKGCYLGQEPIARIDAMGHVNKSLSIINIASPALPEPGATIQNTTSNKEIGQITSVTSSYGDNQSVALGYLRLKNIAEGDELVVDVGGEMIDVKLREK